MRSRRAWNSRTITSTSSCGPVNASTPAHCVAAFVQLTEFTISRVIGVMSSCGTIA